MSVVIDISKNVILQRLRREAIEEGKQEGRQEGLQEGMQTLLRDQLKARFGRLPKWASERLASATTTQMEKWAKKVVFAETLEDVLGKQ